MHQKTCHLPLGHSSPLGIQLCSRLTRLWSPLVLNIDYYTHMINPLRTFDFLALPTVKLGLSISGPEQRDIALFIEIINTTLVLRQPLPPSGSC